ncbi:hypothetical protein F2Q70_00032496 [Brassica cretica]|uniref:Exocyst subunit Exo70 family protein n=1 Tax=Brassica cretica TaxID=69181 RepID=A0A8S9FKI8_BRACR|nr:hypothetical protein F2Q70_00032496 [Brassica cretica]
MAFLSKLGNILKQTNAKGSLSTSPSLFQAIRCMSSSKLFIGGEESSSRKFCCMEYGILPSTFSPMARHLRSIVTALESTLERKAQLYAEEPLKYIFLMNNCHYMVQKVKTSELRHFFGDEWIRKHIASYQHNVTDYERATWSSVLSLLKDNSKDSVSTSRDRCRLFCLAFDDVYKNQTRWSVPDPELRDDLHISTSVKVVQSYRGFLARNADRIGEKHVRYTCEDIESLLLDLFECLPSPRSLRSSRRRW